MNRSEFVSGKKEDKKKPPVANLNKEATVLVNGKVVGTAVPLNDFGNPIGTKSLKSAKTSIPDAFIDKLDNYIPKK